MTRELKILHFGLDIPIAGLVGFFFCIFMLSTPIFYPENKTFSISTILGFLFGAAIAVYLIASYFVTRYLLYEDGMSYRNFRTLGRGLKWSEVIHVSYAGGGMGWFRLETQYAEVVRVSILFTGLEAFVDLALKHVPRNAIEPKALAALQSIASGKAPR
jgi:hypothetical protein